MKVRKIGLEPKYRVHRSSTYEPVDLNKAIDAFKSALPALVLFYMAVVLTHTVLNALNNRSISDEERMMMAAEMPQPLA